MHFNLCVYCYTPNCLIHFCSLSVRENPCIKDSRHVTGGFGEPRARVDSSGRRRGHVNARRIPPPTPTPRETGPRAPLPRRPPAYPTADRGEHIKVARDRAARAAAEYRPRRTDVHDCDETARRAGVRLLQQSQNRYAMPIIFNYIFT